MRNRNVIGNAKDAPSRPLSWRRQTNCWRHRPHSHRTWAYRTPLSAASRATKTPPSSRPPAAFSASPGRATHRQFGSLPRRGSLNRPAIALAHWSSGMCLTRAAFVCRCCWRRGSPQPRPIWSGHRGLSADSWKGQHHEIYLRNFLRWIVKDTGNLLEFWYWYLNALMSRKCQAIITAVIELAKRPRLFIYLLEDLGAIRVADSDPGAACLQNKVWILNFNQGVRVRTVLVTRFLTPIIAGACNRIQYLQFWILLFYF